MANVWVGPEGASFEDIGDLSCAPTTNTSTTHMLGAIQNVLAERFFLGSQYAKPNFIDIGRHLSMKPSSSGQITNTYNYESFIGYTNSANDRRGYIDLTPTKSSKTGNFSTLNACGINVPRSIALSLETNARGCAPGGVDAALPHYAREQYARVAFGTIQHLPAMCTQEFIEKDPKEFVSVFRDYMRAVEDHLRYSHELEEYRWVISQTRYNITAWAQTALDGNAQLVEDESVIQAFSFNQVPNHWGSAEWISQMLKMTALDHTMAMTVPLPVSILLEYKKQLNAQYGIIFMGSPGGFTGDLNKGQVTLYDDSIVYRDLQTGRKLTFTADPNPVYVEVVDEGPEIGEWFFQEMYTTRLSDDSSFVVPGQFNWKYGVQCSCENRTLAALITVSNGTAFHKEPLPNTPPAELKAAIMDKVRDFKLNASMAEVWTSTIKFEIFTGLEAEAYVLQPWRDKLIAAGFPCPVFDNSKNTWFGGRASQGAVYVTDRPRQIVNFLLAIPTQSKCVAAMTACPTPAVAPDPKEITPGERTTEDLQVNVPPAPEPTPPAEGEIFVLMGNRTITAPCTGTKTFNIGLRRKGGTAGAIAATLTKNAGESTVATVFYDQITVSSPVNFADGVTEGTSVVTIPAMVCGETDVEATQLLVIDVAGDISADTYQTITICIRCAEADSCPDANCAPAGGCATC